MASSDREVKWTCDLCAREDIVAKHYYRPDKWKVLTFEVKNCYGKIQEDRLVFDVCWGCLTLPTNITEIAKKSLLQKTTEWILGLFKKGSAK